MALLDFLKRKKEVEKAKPTRITKKSVVGEVKKEVENTGKSLDTTEKSAKKQSSSQKSNVKSFSYEVVREPHISEKSTNLGQDNKYVFKIYKNANKPEIKKAVEGVYGVDVLSVNIIKIPKKKRRLGKTEGFRKGYSKAVVTIKEGQKIEIF